VAGGDDIQYPHGCAMPPAKIRIIFFVPCTSSPLPSPPLRLRLQPAAFSFNLVTANWCRCVAAVNHVILPIIELSTPHTIHDPSNQFSSNPYIHHSIHHHTQMVCSFSLFAFRFSVCVFFFYHCFCSVPIYNFRVYCTSLGNSCIISQRSSVTSIMSLFSRYSHVVSIIFHLFSFRRRSARGGRWERRVGHKTA